jgi:O-antigen ligase
MYNDKHPEKMVHMTFNSLSIMLALNLIGFYVFGLKNGIHSIEGRLSLPFIDGMYSGACMIAILNLMLYYYMKKAIASTDGFRFTYLLIYFLLNLLFLYFINSRLANMTFLVVFGLVFLNIVHRVRGLFIVGVLFVPLLLNLGFFLYQILSLPVFKAIMQRVDLKDVTTFNGRSYAWTSALDWLLNDQVNVVFGNGHNGHYFLHLMTNIAKLWGVKETDTHLHSTSLSILVDQGIVGLLLIIIVSAITYRYFRKRLGESKDEGIFFAVMVFILIVMQVDMFVYRDCTGAIILAALAAVASVKWKRSLT